jgi:hypothetical protein
MKNFFVYDNTTLEIVRKGTCQDEHIEEQRLPGCTLIEGDTGMENRMIDGVPVYVPPPPPTADDLSMEDEQAHRMTILSNVPGLMFAIENRLRALEKKPAITLEDFKAEAKAK